jgi:hypothetical protein
MQRRKQYQPVLSHFSRNQAKLRPANYEFLCQPFIPAGAEKAAANANRPKGKIFSGRNSRLFQRIGPENYTAQSTGSSDRMSNIQTGLWPDNE